jgi:predicted nucleic acid-binding protein
MDRAEAWFICRVGFVEVARALAIAAGPAALRALRREWPAFAVIEVDLPLVERAAGLTRGHSLRSRDALHLAGALLLPTEGLLFATWDARQHAAARANALEPLPASLGEG